MEVTVIRHTYSSPEDEPVFIYEGTSHTTENLVLQIVEPWEDNYEFLNYTLCLKQNQIYTVELQDLNSSKYGWDYGSYIDIIYEGIRLYYGDFDDNPNKVTSKFETFTIDINFMSNPQTIWKYTY